MLWANCPLLSQKLHWEFWPCIIKCQFLSFSSAAQITTVAFISQIFSSSFFSFSISFKLLMFLLPDAFDTRDQCIYHNCLLLVAIIILSVWIWNSHRTLTCSCSSRVGGGFPFGRCFTDFLVYDASHMVWLFHECLTCLHLTTCCHVTSGTPPAPEVPSDMVDPSFYWSWYCLALFLCFCD